MVPCMVLTCLGGGGAVLINNGKYEISEVALCASVKYFGGLAPFLKAVSSKLFIPLRIQSYEVSPVCWVV